MLGIDYSAGVPNPAAVKKAGYGFVARYVSNPGNPKNLTRAEATRMRAAGVDIVVVFESFARRALGGRAAGHADGLAARSQAEACGAPTNSAIYAAVDFDVTSSAELRVVAEYFDGFRGALGPHPAGAYGELTVVDTLLAGKHATYGWQTGAWSGGKLSQRAHLYQRIGGVRVDGIACDVDVALKPTFGQWGRAVVITHAGHPNPYRFNRTVGFPIPPGVAGATKLITVGRRQVRALVGPDVKAVQWAAGMALAAIDGVAGPDTHAAIVHFQTGHHDVHGHPLARDGVAGDLTIGAMRLVKR